MLNSRRRLVVCAALVTVFSLATQTHAQFREPFRPELRGVVKSADAKSITVAFGGGRETAPSEKTYALAKNLEVCVGSRSGGIFKEIKLGEIPVGTSVALGVSADQKSVESIVAEEPIVRGTLKSVDAKKNTMTVSVFAGREEGPDAKTYRVNLDAEIAVDDGRGRRFSFKEAKLEDLVEGATVMLRLSLDQKQANAVFAEGATIAGAVKSIDATKRMMTITVRPARGDEAAEERTIAIAKEAAILIDDGKGRRLSIKEAKLADIPVGTAIIAKLAVDQSFVMFLQAEGPTLGGMLKAVDAEKRTITIAMQRSREEVEEKTLTVAKDARVMLDGKESNLADLMPGENGPFIQLRLTLNQQAVQSVSAHAPRPR